MEQEELLMRWGNNYLNNGGRQILPKAPNLAHFFI